MRAIWILMLLLISGVSHAKYEGHGKVTMTGEIIDAACSIATDDIWQEIDFGTIPLKDVLKDKTLTKPFTLHLINCRLDKEKGGTWKSVNITFDGPVDDRNADLFSMSGEGKGVGVIITDEHGNQAVSGQHMPDQKLNENNTDLNFTLSLVRNGEHLTPGDVSTFLRFMVAYQ